ncbi:2-isopropylmalate synthase [Streptomyces sp. NBC_01451]|uniref:2-isopropylmalate synthase n=1 Tax=Streptomyces sp. NBC_01451 TaxID=2903872 RepID=UPI002E3483A5|nr:2-isopropylmalate synthase [Streptomyces sp. NBC_01451]
MQHVGNHRRYGAFTPIVLRDRTWPDKVISAAPRWLSTDLRDGNQALANPMSPARKLAMFDLLVDMGYKEIEVGFPVASQDDHDFVRALIEQDRIPDNVRISVLVQAREELIRRTVESLRGARKATVHVYNATAPLFREVVFGMSRGEVMDLAVQGTSWTMKYAERTLADCDLGFQYSPELFNETEPEFAVEVCEAVMDVWQPEEGREIVLNFPSTVERSLPHVFADQIEWLDRNLSRREHRCLSVHPHNDRGTGVAATEMALLAGAQRVEGCLFGSGERAGNVCLVTLGMNMFTHGVDPHIDFSDIDHVRRTVEYCNEMPVSPRHPYGGELVYTAFSGSHQDAIKKGFDALERKAAVAGSPIDGLPWEMPYLPLDPKDVGRSYEAVVRINSQSGKGGIAYVMSAWHGMNLPRELRVEFSRTIQSVSDRTGMEVTPDRLRELFEQEYLTATDQTQPLRLRHEPLVTTLFIDGAESWKVPADPGTHTDTYGDLTATLAPWGIEVSAVHRTSTTDTRTVCGDSVTVYARCSVDGRAFWGCGINSDPHAAAFSAVRVAATRAGQIQAPNTPAPSGLLAERL